MFYLLENNKIIDTNELLNSGIQINIKKSQKFKVVYLVSWFGERFLGTIKKQSKNVFDLIEKGDLLKISQEKNYVFEQYNEPETTNYASYIKEAYPKKIIAIYKPDDKGNYIKVWERKEED